MWFTPAATAARSTRSASPRSRGGPKTPSPASCITPYPARRTRHGPSANDPPSSRPFMAPVTVYRSGAIGGDDRTADRRGGVAHEVDDGVGDGVGRDRVREQIRCEERTGRGGVEQLRRDAVHPDPGRAQLQVENPDELDQGCLAQRVA